MALFYFYTVLCLLFNLLTFTGSTLPYGGVFIAMALVWGLLFERVIPDFYDILGAVIAIIGVVIIFYVPRKGEEALWQR